MTFEEWSLNRRHSGHYRIVQRTCRIPDGYFHSDPHHDKSDYEGNVNAYDAHLSNHTECAEEDHRPYSAEETESDEKEQEPISADENPKEL